jgi:hypothetical protein
MAIRSVIARPTAHGWQARYRHYDGYPSHQGRMLHAAVLEASYRQALDENSVPRRT